MGYSAVLVLKLNDPLNGHENALLFLYVLSSFVSSCFEVKEQKGHRQKHRTETQAPCPQHGSSRRRRRTPWWALACIRASPGEAVAGSLKRPGGAARGVSVRVRPRRLPGSTRLFVMENYKKQISKKKLERMTVSGGNFAKPGQRREGSEFTMRRRHKCQTTLMFLL